MDVTILICTHNSAGLIGRTLRHLKSQKVSPSVEWEILIVDFQSTDETVKTCRDEWQNHPIELRVIQEKRPGKSPALETGLAEARGEAVCIIDDDNWVDPGYVQSAHLVIAAHPDVGAIGAQGRPRFEVPPPPWFHVYSGVYAVGHQAEKAGYVEPGTRMWFWGAGTVVRNSAWRAVRRTGFSLVLNPSRQGGARVFKRGFAGGEDQEMCFALQLAGYKLWYEPNLIFEHYLAKERLTTSYLFKTTLGTARAIPVLKLYLSALPCATLTQRVKSIVYRSLVLMLLQEACGVVAGAIRTTKSPFKVIEMTRVFLRFRGSVDGLLNVAGRSRSIFVQIDKVRRLASSS